MLGFALVMAIRLTVPLTIWRWPLAGGLLSIVADTIDILIFDVAGFPSFASYQQIDKALDLYYLAIEFVVAQHWQSLPRWTASALFAYRLVGVAVFETTGARAALLVFPNLFELFFLWVVAALHFTPNYQFTLKRITTALAVLLVPKLIQEYLLHYARVLDDLVATDVIGDTAHGIAGWFRSHLP